MSNNGYENDTREVITIPTGLDTHGLAECVGDQIMAEDNEAIEKKLKGRCYLCRRVEGSESYYLEGSSLSTAVVGLLPFDVVILNDLHLRYMLCVDCLMMIDAVLGSRHEVQEGEKCPPTYPPAFKLVL